MAERKPRGSYAKGTAKREEILQHAIDAFGRTGYHGTSMREIAQACGLSQAGLLHHFPSKEAILMAIVEDREQQQGTFGEMEVIYTPEWQDFYIRQVEENIKNEAVTRLWSNMLGEAIDVAHPAHEYFKERYKRSRTNFEQNISKANGRDVPNREDKLKAQILIAIWDGLENQWLLDESFDMMPAFQYSLEMISRYSQYK